MIVCPGTEVLLSLSLARFLVVLSTARSMATAVSSINHVRRSGLVNDGSGRVSLIRSHGLSEEWKPILRNEEGHSATFPGYLTSKNGSKMDDENLDRIRTSISHVTGIKAPFNNMFSGDPTE